MLAGRLSLVFLVLVLALFSPATAAAQGKKKLTAENVMDLLSNGVALQRVTYLVRERGIDFQVTGRLEQAFLDGGANEALINAMKGDQVSPATGTSSNTVADIQIPQPVTSSQPSEPALPATAPSRGRKSSVPSGASPTGLQIRSKPGGVTIFVDDELKGQTDPEEGALDVVGLTPGKHRLRAIREGYQDLEGPVQVAMGKLEETPVWLAKAEVPQPATTAVPELPAGKKFLVRHTHKAVQGLGGAGFCQGWMIVGVGYIRYLSTDSPHKYLMNTSEIRDAKASSGLGGLVIKLDFGRKYEFVAVDDKGHEIGVGPLLTEIRYSMGQ